MLKTNNASTSDAQKHKDKMRLTVTSVYPAFQEKLEQEV